MFQSWFFWHWAYGFGQSHFRPNFFNLGTLFQSLKSGAAAVTWHLHFLGTGTQAFPLNLSISCFVICRRGVEICSYLSRQLKGQEKAWSERSPMPVMPSLCGISPWIYRRTTGVRESPEQGQPHCKSRARTLMRNDRHSFCGLWNSIYISSGITTNLRKVKTMLNLPAHTPCWCNMM